MNALKKYNIIGLKAICGEVIYNELNSRNAIEIQSPLPIVDGQMQDKSSTIERGEQKSIHKIITIQLIY
jgi:hypothetical protein